MNLPIAREKNIVIQNLGEEVLIYDLEINRAYCLNETASVIYQACDGQNSFSDLERDYGLDADLILLTLVDFQKNNLLKSESLPDFPNVSRREIIRRIGLTSAFALPMISILVAPTSANAASRSTCATPGAAADGASVSSAGSGSGDAAAQSACLSNLNCLCSSGQANGSIGFCAGASSSRSCACSGTCQPNCVVAGGSATGSTVATSGSGSSDAAARTACLQNLNNRCCSGSASGNSGFCAGASSSRSCTCNGTCN